MAISRISIQNYRSIEHCEVRPGRLCALVGENNAGKSNILRALNLVFGRDWAIRASAIGDEEFFRYDTSRDILIECEFEPALEYQPYKYGDPAQVSVIRFTVTHYKIDTKQGKKGDRRIETRCLSSDGKAIQILAEAPKAGKQRKYEPLVGLPEDIRRQVPVIFVGADRRLEDQMPTRQGSLLRRLLEDVDAALRVTTIEEDGIEKNVHALFVERLQAALSALRIPEFLRLEDLLRKHALDNMGYTSIDADRLRFKFGLLESLDFFKAMKLLFNENGFEMDATSMGEGAQNALILAIFQSYEELRKRGAIFLVEEPEMYLHPHRRRVLYDVFRRLSEGNQVIYTTHSTSFVAIPEYEDVHRVCRDSGDTTKVRSSTLSPTPERREKLRKEFDPERNDLFFARRVILVEGDTEKLAIPEYAARMGVDLNRCGCSIVEVGGKRNLKPFMEVVRSFDIPVTVVFDTDSSDFQGKRAEEDSYNAELRAFQADDVRIVELLPNYEAEVRKELGEEEYQRLCQLYAGTSKPIRARLIAQDKSTKIPKPVESIINSLADNIVTSVDS